MDLQFRYPGKRAANRMGVTQIKDKTSTIPETAVVIPLIDVFEE
jgi:hypothetical protein